MEYYVQYTVVKDGKTVVDCLGNGSVFKLDGRRKLKNMIYDSMLNELKIKSLKIDGYKIIRGEIGNKNNQVLYTWLRSGARKQ